MSWNNYVKYLWDIKWSNQIDRLTLWTKQKWVKKIRNIMVLIMGLFIKWYTKFYNFNLFQALPVNNWCFASTCWVAVDPVSVSRSGRLGSVTTATGLLSDWGSASPTPSGLMPQYLRITGNVYALITFFWLDSWNKETLHYLCIIVIRVAFIYIKEQTCSRTVCQSPAGT